MRFWERFYTRVISEYGIIRGTDKQKRNQITRYTNNQNAVRGKDFFALEDFHKTLQGKFRRIKYYYEIQRGAFKSLTRSEKAQYTGNNTLLYLVDDKFQYRIPAFESAQSYAAGFRNLPGVAYGGSDKLTPTGSEYDKVFDDRLEPEPRLFLLPYLIRIWAQKNGYGRGALEDWRKYAVLFFVHVYFTLVLDLLKQLEIVKGLESSPEAIPLEIWERIFENKDLNLILLSLADRVLVTYSVDSRVHDAVGQDVRKFLRSQDMLDRHKDILHRIIDRMLSSRDYTELIEETLRTIQE